jgi:DNA-binding transcriptional regulator YbjK
VSDRRKLIAAAAITVIDTHGARGLTHRRVDETAGLPSGTTSYYAPTRRELLALTIEAIVTEPALQPSRDELPSSSTVDEVVALLVAGIERAAEAAAALRARSAILPELRQWPELAQRLSLPAPIALDRQAKAVSILESLGLTDVTDTSYQLTALCEALLLYRVTHHDAVNLEEILRAYLTGIGARIS